MTSGPPPAGNGSGPTPDTAAHWYFGIVDESENTSTNAIFDNVTTPEGFSQGDTVYIAASAWDTGNVYDQEGIVAGSFDVTNTTNYCGDTNDWCAYFSTCFASGSNGYCSSSGAGWITYEWAIASNALYEESMSLQPSGTQTEFTADLYYMGPTDEHALVHSFSEVRSGDDQFLVGWHYAVGKQPEQLDFTDYEEVYGTNPVEDWPAFNLATETAISSGESFNWGWFHTSGAPSGPAYVCNADDSNAAVQCVYSFDDGQELMSFDNLPFQTWVAYYFGYGGPYEAIVTGAEGSSFSVTVGIDPFADPEDGFLVLYNEEYCGSSTGVLPCGDFSFSPGFNDVQPASDYDTPIADMTVAGTIPSEGIYVMSLYTEDQSADFITFLSQWLIYFEY